MKWGVVATVNEPEPLLRAFVAYHLALGASEVVLHLDVPDEGLARRLKQAGAGVIVHQPAPEDLATRRPTPERQARNAALTYAATGVDWLLHIDADEFLWEAGRVLEALAAAPPDVMALGVAPLDRVWRTAAPPQTIFDGLFRGLAPGGSEGALRRIYGPALDFLDRGIAGNGAAKFFVRTGRQLRMGVHEPTDKEGRAVLSRLLPGGALLHFDGATPAHYIAKLQRKIRQQPAWPDFPAPGRRAQLRAVWEAGGDQRRLEALTRAAKFLTPEQEEALTALGLLLRLPFDPRPALDRIYPGERIDLTLAAFDAHALGERSIRWSDRLRDRLRAWRRMRVKRANGPDQPP